MSIPEPARRQSSRVQCGPLSLQDHAIYGEAASMVANERVELLRVISCVPTLCNLNMKPTINTLLF